MADSEVEGRAETSGDESLRTKQAGQLEHLHGTANKPLHPHWPVSVGSSLPYSPHINLCVELFPSEMPSMEAANGKFCFQLCKQTNATSLEYSEMWFAGNFDPLIGSSHGQRDLIF